MHKLYYATKQNKECGAFNVHIYIYYGPIKLACSPFQMYSVQVIYVTIQRFVIQLAPLVVHQVRHVRRFIVVCNTTLICVQSQYQITFFFSLTDFVDQLIGNDSSPPQTFIRTHFLWHLFFFFCRNGSINLLIKVKESLYLLQHSLNFRLTHTHIHA